MSTSAVDQQSSVVEDVEAFLEQHEPRVLSESEMAELQLMLWRLRDNAGNARLCLALAVQMNAILGITESAFNLAREMKAGAL